MNKLKSLNFYHYDRNSASTVLKSTMPTHLVLAL